LSCLINSRFCLLYCNSTSTCFILHQIINVIMKQTFRLVSLISHCLLFNVLFVSFCLSVEVLFIIASWVLFVNKNFIYFLLFFVLFFLSRYVMNCNIFFDKSQQLFVDFLLPIFSTLKIFFRQLFWFVFLLATCFILTSLIKFVNMFFWFFIAIFFWLFKIFFS